MLVNVEGYNKHLLQELIPKLSLPFFRYFDKRTINIIENHLTTLMYLKKNSPIGYGHLDKEGNKVWLGIAVLDGYHGVGIGKEIMEKLIYSAKTKTKEIFLSVDKDNFKAIGLYHKFGFKISEIKKDSYIYKLTL